jgi:hypothetical protein
MDFLRYEPPNQLTPDSGSWTDTSSSVDESESEADLSFDEEPPSPVVGLNTEESELLDHLVESSCLVCMHDGCSFYVEVFSSLLCLTRRVQNQRNCNNTKKMPLGTEGISLQFNLNSLTATLLHSLSGAVRNERNYNDLSR